MSKRAAVYVRVSSDEQIVGLSLDVQEKACSKAAEDRGFVVAEVFRDEGFSAFSGAPRPAYDGMMARVKEFDAIFVLRLDRFARQQAVALQVVGGLIEQGVGWYSVNEQYDFLDPMGWAMFSMSAMFAELSSRLTSVRVRDSIEEAVSRGRTIAPPPFGYFLPAPKVVIELDPETSPVARGIFEKYRDGDSVISICRWLDSLGIKSPRSKGKWMPQTVMAILRSQTYRGKVGHKRTGQVVEGLHEALIDDETWWLCQEKMDRNRLVSPRAREGSLSSLLYCGHCGSRMVYHSHGQYYFCKQRVMSAERHEPLTIRRYIIEGYIWMVVQEMLLPEAEREFQVAYAHADNSAALARLRGEKREIEQKIVYNLRAARETELPMHLLADENRPLQERLAQVEAEMSEAVRGASVPDRAVLAETIGRIHQEGYGRQREFLSQFIRKVTVHGAYIEFRAVPEAMPTVKIVRQRFYGKQEKSLVLEQVAD